MRTKVALIAHDRRKPEMIALCRDYQEMLAQEEDPQNLLIMDAMAPNVAGVIGSAVAAGVLLSMLR